LDVNAVRVEGIAYARFRAPDLDRAEAFLRDFGLQVAGRDSERLWMRGGASPFLHLTELGEPGFAGHGLSLSSMDELSALAAAEGLPIEDIDGPGGGVRVRLTDPNGFEVDAVFGREPQVEEPVGTQTWNMGDMRDRIDVLRRVSAGPAHPFRIGHIVMLVSDLQESWRWYSERFALLISDEVRAPDIHGTPVALFIRNDLGPVPVDHHMFNFATLPNQPAGFNHIAFEVRDIDDLMAGDEHLRSAGWSREWGIGRHILGSNIFNYWSNPWGQWHEHWTDGDALTASAPAGLADLAAMLGSQWGPALPHPPAM
jgi:catechol 2,3-dioxygenase-like lactoylglutathione lyase family enzyme